MRNYNMVDDPPLRSAADTNEYDKGRIAARPTVVIYYGEYIDNRNKKIIANIRAYKYFHNKTIKS